VTEWRGWNFVDPFWWAEVAAQGRDGFIDATGMVIAVADSDEWDDLGHDPGPMDTFMTTPSLAIPGTPNPKLQFDTSWRAEGNQTATITASYDGGAPVEVFRWESDANSQYYMPDENPGFVEVPLTPPAGAQNVQFTFGYTNANNNWWWAVDNLAFGTYSEDFEGVQLGPNVSEGRVQRADNVWTATPPSGWSIENMVPGQNEPNDNNGVTEWIGWSFTNKDWWVGVAGNQRRSEFAKGQGAIAVADPDEWDDAPHPDSASEGWYNTFMSLAPISLDGVDPGTVELKFDSSWRPEFDDNYHQTANITVSFDGGAPVEVLLWESDENSDNFHDDNSTNETITVPINNPAGAKSMVIKFGLYEAGNDWWWGIDNLSVTGRGGVARGDFNGDGTVNVADIDLLTGGMMSGDRAFDLTGDGNVNFDDRLELVKGIIRTWIGDSNSDGEFNSSDFVSVFTTGKYETGLPATWAQGDWNGDGVFNSGDFVTAFSDAGYEKGPLAAVSSVPEPSGLMLPLLGVFALWAQRRSN
jgi:hypothetical protein